MDDSRRALRDLVNEKLGKDPFARAAVRIHKGVKAGAFDADPQGFLEKAFGTVLEELEKADKADKDRAAASPPSAESVDKK